MSYKKEALNQLLEMRASGAWISCAKLSEKMKSRYSSVDGGLQLMHKEGILQREQRRIFVEGGMRRMVWHYRIRPELTIKEIMQRAGFDKDPELKFPRVTAAAALDKLFSALNRVFSVERCCG